MSFISFIIDNFPSVTEFLIGVTVGIVVATVFLYGAGYLKRYKKVPTAYTRKIVHVSMFSAAAVVQAVATLGVVFSGAFGVVVIYLIVIAKGSGNIMYESIAREADAPQRTKYILLPAFATALGASFNTYYFGPMAIFGYLVAGIGDSAGEPVGKRFGKHKLPSIKRGKSKKTIEGSLGVLAGSFLAIQIGLLFTGLSMAWYVALFAAFIFMLIELASPRGTDNFFMQVFPALIMFYLIM